MGYTSYYQTKSCRIRQQTASKSLALVPLLSGIDLAGHTLALPTASVALGMSPAMTVLGAGLATVVAAALLPQSPWLVSRVGQRRALLLSTAGLAAGALTTAVAPSPTAFLVGRALTGVALAVSLPTSMAVLRGLGSDRPAGRLTPHWLIVQALTAGVAALSCGALIDALGWRSCYLLFTAISILFGLCAVVVVPDGRALGHRLDTPGLLLTTGMLLTAVLGVGQAGVDARAVAGGLGCALLLAVLLAWWESHADSPSLPVRLFGVPSFTMAVLASAAVGFATAGTLLAVSFGMQGRGHPASTVSLLFAPLLGCMVLGALSAARAARRGLSSAALLTRGLVLVTVGVGTAAFDVGGWRYPAAAALLGFAARWTQHAQPTLVLAATLWPVANPTGPPGAVSAAVGQLGAGLGAGVAVAILAAHGVGVAVLSIAAVSVLAAAVVRALRERTRRAVRTRRTV